MALIVQKYGGTSVADLDRINAVADRVKTTFDAGEHVAVVVSAMAGTTDQLVNWVRSAAPLHDAREYVGASPRPASVASPTQARPTRWL